MALLDSGVTTIARTEGEATVHSSSLLHAVKRGAPPRVSRDTPAVPALHRRVHCMCDPHPTFLRLSPPVASGVRYSLVLFFGRAPERPPPPELEFDDDARAAEAFALRELMADEELRRTVVASWGEDQLDRLHRTFDALTHTDPAPVAIGRVIEVVIQAYGAPHLRPTSIRERARDGKVRASGLSLRALLRYIEEELKSAAA